MAPAFHYQLYSSRNHGPLEDTLRMLADLGYAGVEGYGGVYGDLPALTRALEDTGLTMPTGHFSLEMFETDRDGVLRIAEATGMKRLYCPFLMPDQRPADGAGWRAFGARLDAAGAPYRAAGYGFGWHNHHFEFARTPDGVVPQEAIFEGGPELEWEADIAWIIRGEADPFDWIARHGHRITAVHVKDIGRSGQYHDEDGWADLGEGTVDWSRVMAALRETAPDAYLIMEHDKPSDDRRFARRSLSAAQAM